MPEAFGISGTPRNPLCSPKGLIKNLELMKSGTFYPLEFPNFNLIMVWSVCGPIIFLSKIFYKKETKFEGTEGMQPPFS
jgi:hypothetical protein